MDTSATQPSIKFDLSFTQDVDSYISQCQEQNIKVSVKGFADRLGVSEDTIWAWANKKKKDSEGNITEELARPKFNGAVLKLEELSKEVETTNAPTKKKATKSQPAPEEVRELPQEDKGKKLNPKQELFCQLYATNRDCFGNGVETYAEAYGLDLSIPKNYNTARSNSWKLLTNTYILKRIDDLLVLGPLNDSFVDRQLAHVIEQNADFGAKTAAIREYNKLRSRITTKLDHTTNGKDMPTPIYNGKSTD